MVNLSVEQMEAVGFLFEEAKGNKLGKAERQIIASIPLPTQDIAQLTQAIVRFIESDPDSAEARAQAYWALSKLYDKALTPLFRSWLWKEWELDSPALFQVMIALDNVDEPVFNKDRSGYGAVEVELNRRDAEQYLKKTGRR